MCVRFVLDWLGKVRLVSSICIECVCVSVRVFLVVVVDMYCRLKVVSIFCKVLCEVVLFFISSIVGDCEVLFVIGWFIDCDCVCVVWFVLSMLCIMCVKLLCW